MSLIAHDTDNLSTVDTDKFLEYNELMITSIKKCLQCSKDFEAKRSDAKFCSNTCKQANKRGSEKISVAGESATMTTESLQEAIETLKTAVPIEQDVVQFIVVEDDMLKPVSEVKREESNYEETVRMGKEATEFLMNHTYEECVKLGVWIPNWKRPHRPDLKQ